MDTALGWSIGAIVLVLLVTAYLSALETVLVRLPLVRALRLHEEKVRGSGALQWLLEHRATSLNVVLLLTVAARLVVAVVAAVAVTDRNGGPWLVALVTVGLLTASLVLAEVAPRTLALRHLEETGLRLGRISRALISIFDPVARLFVITGRALVHVRAEVSGPFAADEEVRDLAGEEETDDELEDDERAMIHSIFELGDTVVREIMRPRPDLTTVDEDSPLRTLVNAIIEHGYSRIPVQRAGSEEVVGIVHAKDVLKRLAHQPGRDRWSDLVRPATFVPETKSISDLLREMQAHAIHLAIVVDEYGQLAGVVTIEDILEEIVGEIVDEHDREDPLVEFLRDAEVRVDARLSVDDLNDLLDSELPDEGWDTVGGLVVGTLGRVPDVGDTVDIEGLTLTAEQVQGRRVAKVLVTRREPTHATIDIEAPSP